jgi:hypothetical protein
MIPRRVRTPAFSRRGGLRPGGPKDDSPRRQPWVSYALKNQPQRGERCPSPGRCTPDSVAPSGAVFPSFASLTAYAVGYRLPVLRTSPAKCSSNFNPPVPRSRTGNWRLPCGPPGGGTRPSMGELPVAGVRSNPIGCPCRTRRYRDPLGNWELETPLQFGFQSFSRRSRVPAGCSSSNSRASPMR